MTLSAFALFLTRRTELVFNIGHFLIILLFLTPLATFRVSISLIFLSFLKSLFWLKQIQGSVRVKIKEYVHAWSEFLFVSRLVIFNFCLQINHIYYFRSLHGLQDVENLCAHSRDIELKTGRKKSIYLLSPCLILYIIGFESMKLQN